ncbi:Aste57867_18329 [Aphanomyces stellatus]|uniref:Aste57867_18329 protein n=1 Tax=Aphanomyces stellatus TaxID=120398 RepID=A0A485LA56_9STRA|nr:hypothetical protein As57867_018267 [Aphanomyces stellatus]VFT95065.1 Aste57867_18329 [Aphanomyces stellatus]
MDSAATGGHLDMLKWLRKPTTAGCTTDAVGRAAVGNHWDVVMWLFANCTVGGTTKGPEMAAANGHLELPKWLLEMQKLPCSPHLASNVARLGDVDLLKWFVGKYPDVAAPRLLQSAVAGGNEATAQWILTYIHGVCPDCAVLEAKSNLQMTSLLVAAPNQRCRRRRAKRNHNHGMRPNDSSVLPTARVLFSNVRVLRLSGTFSCYRARPMLTIYCSYDISFTLFTPTIPREKTSPRTIAG